MGSTIVSPVARTLIDRIERIEDFEARSEQEIHLMASQGKKHRKDKHRNKKSKGSPTSEAYSSYDIKGKGREPGTRPDETEQIRLDKQFTENEQARLYEDDNKTATGNAGHTTTKDKAKSKGSNDRKKSKAKSHLDLTQWIETPSPTPESRIPASSPIRALKQIPSGGYLAKAWTGDMDKKRKSGGHKVSRYTKRKLDSQEARVRAWRERSDISEGAIGRGGGPPDDSSSSSDSSSSDSSTISRSHDSDTSTNSEPGSSEDADSVNVSSSRILCSGIASGSTRGALFSLLPPLPYLIWVHTDSYSRQDSSMRAT
ncbi:hypothetical protein M407DRAFT_22522 [Tulasnella calospora MUT 4182]|uniref:Uncharacterized protein n=1 Tax=Tulasnella calospora MUT 4182 TaxID=1051891 RepID=A0A0C3QMY9_9AGAM|nr:hypothetical protein M407DRAFT_22522 [Tulasnella calospora MUT 4182]